MVDLTTPPSNPLAPKVSAVDPYEKEKGQCKAKGGKWDPVNNTCIMPQPINPDNITSKSDPVAYEKLRKEQGFGQKDKSEFGAFKDVETGRLSGFERQGQIYLGADPETVRGALETEAYKQELPIGSQAEGVLTARQQQLQSQGLDLSGQVGNDPLNQLKEQFSNQQIDYVAALASGVPGILPDLAAGAITGALAGSTAAVPTGGLSVPAVALIGAVGNGARGFYSDFVSDITRQRGEQIETPIRTLTETKSILNDITGAQNANPADAALNLEAFNSQLQLLDNEYDRLKDLTDDDLNKFLGENGINQMQEYEVYFTPNGERDRQIADFQLALANPDPARVNPTTVTLEQINKRIEAELKKL